MRLSCRTVLREEDGRLRAENVLLRRHLEEIERRLSKIEAALPQEKVIVLRRISEEQARAEIRRLFSSGRTLYYSDIAEQLWLDLKMVVEICEALRAEREIEADAGALQRR